MCTLNKTSNVMFGNAAKYFAELNSFEIANDIDCYLASLRNTKEQLKISKKCSKSTKSHYVTQKIN